MPKGVFPTQNIGGFVADQSSKMVATITGSNHKYLPSFELCCEKTGL